MAKPAGATTGLSMALALCASLTSPSAAEEPAALTLADLLAHAMAEAETGGLSRTYHWAEVPPSSAAPQAGDSVFDVAALLRRLRDDQKLAYEASGLGEQPFLAAGVSGLVARTKAAVLAALDLGDWLPGSWLSDGLPKRDGGSTMIAALVGDAEPAPSAKQASEIPPAAPAEASAGIGNLADLAAASAAMDQNAPHPARHIKTVTLASLTETAPPLAPAATPRAQRVSLRKPKRAPRQPFSAASLGMRLVPGTEPARLARFLERLDPLPEGGSRGNYALTRLSFAEVLDQAQWARGVFAAQRGVDASSLPARRDLVRNLRLVLTREGEAID